MNDLTFQLNADATALKGVTDGLLTTASGIPGEAPELGGVGASVIAQLVSLQTSAQGAADSAAGRDLAYAQAIADWLGSVVRPGPADKRMRRTARRPHVPACP